MDESNPHLGSEVGVLSICLTTPAPPGVSEDVDVGTKAVETPVLAPNHFSDSYSWSQVVKSTACVVLTDSHMNVFRHCRHVHQQATALLNSTHT